MKGANGDKRRRDLKRRVQQAARENRRTGELKWALKEHEGKRCEGGRDNGKSEEERKVKITRGGVGG